MKWERFTTRRDKLAVGEGFEPSCRFRDALLSREAGLTTPAPYQSIGLFTIVGRIAVKVNS